MYEAMIKLGGVAVKDHYQNPDSEDLIMEG